jgi:acyl-CoA thioesterase-1
MRRWLVVLGVALVTVGCGSKSPTSPGPVDPPPTNPPPSPPSAPPTLGLTRVLGFGDSMTAGTTSPALASALSFTPGLPESYPYKLKAILSARYTAQTMDVQNAGVPGESVSKGRDRLSSALSEARPEVMLLMEGANDLNALNGAGLTDISAVVNAMEDMVRNATGRGIAVIVATLPPQRPSGSPPRGGAGPLLAKYNNELKAMAARKGAMLVDVNALCPLSLIGQDGLHPTEGGYQKLAEIFADVIKTRWEVTSSTASQRSSALLPAPAIASHASRRPGEVVDRPPPR